MEASALTIRGLLCALSLLFVAARADAAVYAVGSDPGCTHATIQEAIWAAEANPEDDFIRIPHSGVWNDQSLVINDAQNLSLEGFWSDCNTLDDSNRTVVDGAGGPEAPVLSINAASGGTIVIDFLTFRNGDNSGDSSKGGGIYYRGNGSLVVSNSSIINNTAGQGGGMYLEGTGTSASVQILGNVGITGNVARDSGGGVFAEAVHLYMVHPNSTIAFNEATGFDVLGVTVGGYGGGLVVNPKSGLDGYADIGGAGVGGAGAIYANSARYGGGIAALGESGIEEDAILRVYTVDPASPVAIRDNFASIAGGGLFVQPRKDYLTFGSRAIAYLWNAIVDLNVAPDGAAIYLGESTDVKNTTVGGEMYWNMGGDLAAPCPSAAPCGRIADNVAADGNGTPTDGAVINLREDAVFGVVQTFGAEQPTGEPNNSRGILIDGNRGGRLFDMEGGEDRVHLLVSNSLIIDNDVSLELLRAQDEPQVGLIDTTIAGNAIGAGYVLSVSDEFILQRSILWQPGTISFTGGGTPTVEQTIASEAESLGGGPGAVVADPRFIDPARGDYGLRAASPAIDYAPPIAGDDRDFFGLPRDQRIGVVQRPEGLVRDIGAFERPTLLPVVLNGDFAGDTNLWFLPAGHAGNYQVNNAPGSPDGTGSAQVAGTSNEGRLLGYAQCIHLPGPGTYLLNGWGRSEGDPQLSNPTALIWEVRLDGGEGCIDGTITAGGTHTLSTQATTDQWTRPLHPASITVTQSEWTSDTSLTVLMAVYPNPSDNGGYNGLFDGIALEWSADGSDVIFEDDFDGP